MKIKLLALATLAMASTGAMAFEAVEDSANFSATTTVPASCVVSDMVGTPDIVFGTGPSTDFGSFTVDSNVDGVVTYEIAGHSTDLLLVETGAAPVFNDKAAGIAFVDQAGAIISVENANIVTLDKGTATVQIGLDTNLGSEKFIATDAAITTATVTFTCPDGVAE